MTITVDQTQLETANIVLASFSTSQIEIRKGGYYVCWKSYGGRPVAKRWVCRGQDFYPMWSKQWPGGGTASTALSQLIRWLRGQPVLPISSWQYWESETCQLLPEGTTKILIDADYPLHARCVLCGEWINGRLDWWNLDGVSGPCCGWTTGCCQRPKRAEE